MKKSIALISIFALILFTSPFRAMAATTVHVDCSYTNTTSGAATCTGNTWTFTGTYPSVANQTVFQSSQTGGPFVTGRTWYVSATYTAAAGASMAATYCIRGNCAVTHFLPSTGAGTYTVTDAAITDTGATGWFFIDNNGSQNGFTSNFIGTVTNVCITDTPGGCASVATFNFWQFFDF